MALAAVTFGNNPKFETKDVVLICVWCGMVGSLSLYGGLYYFVYRLKVTEDGVYLRTILKNNTFNLAVLRNMNVKDIIVLGFTCLLFISMVKEKL